MIPSEIEASIKQFLRDFKKGEYKYSNEIACETVKLLEKIVTNSRWEAAIDLMNIIREIGKRLTDDIHPPHVVVGNMVKRVLKIIRDEYSSALGKDDEYDQQESLQKMLVAEEQMDFAKKFDSLKKSIAANLRELMEELEKSPQHIAEQALDHIHFDEIIMTFGYSRTVEMFLKKAASKRKCKVYVAEAAPFLKGHDLAVNLAESGIETVVILDEAMAALLPLVTKVVIGTHGVMANGGLKATCGIHALALCAKADSVPVLVLAPLFKLTPQYVTSSDQEGFNHMLSPQTVMSYADHALFPDVEIINPAFDYVPPELVTLLISNSGAHPPSYVYRLLSEVYHRDDYDQ